MPEQWEVVEPLPVHVCALPDPKSLPVGTVVRCTLDLPQRRRPGGKVPPAVPCYQQWRLGRTWFWRDPIWRLHRG